MRTTLCGLLFATALLSERLQFDLPEPHGLAFGLEGDVAEAEEPGGAGIQEVGGGGDVVFGIELRALVAEDFDALRGQPGVASSVMIRAGAGSVDQAVNLDREAQAYLVLALGDGPLPSKA